MLIDNFLCLTKDKGAREVEYHCNDVYVRKMRYIRDVVPRQYQFQSYCCAFNAFSNCVLDLVNYVCNERHGLQTSDFFSHKMLSMQKSFADIERCDALCRDVPFNISARLDAIDNDNELKPEYESPVLLFMDIAAAHTKSRGRLG